MSTSGSFAADALKEVMEARRAQVRMRLAIGVTVAVLFHGLTGWPAALVWVSAYLGLQAAEYVAYGGDRLDRIMASESGRRASLMLIALNQLVFGGFGLAEAVHAGAFGITCAMPLICGNLLNGVLIARASRAAFIAAVAPLIGYFILIPLLAGVPLWVTLGVIMAGMMNLVAATMIWQSTSRSITAERAARIESEARRLEAERAVDAKSAFVAVVSHELRTPISAILAAAADLERSEDRAAWRQARLIGDAGAMMRGLLNDLLDMAKLEAGRLTVDASPYDLRSLMSDLMRFWRTEAKARGLRLAFEGARETPRRVIGDPIRVRQILNNLVSNALKFTECGQVTLSVEREDAPGGHALRISVTDTGSGMTEEQISRLFTPFEQLGQSTARTHGGAGLGLAISRDLARLMGGDISVRSAPGQGAAFTLSLECADAEDMAAQAPAPAAPDIPAGLRLLVCDDHEINRRALSLVLAPLSATVFTVASGAEALERLAAQTFDLVLMDCFMPEMDGLETTRRLRAADGPNRSTPVIAVTASTEAGDIAACQAAGMTAHVGKPIDPQSLYAAIAEVIADREDRPLAAAG